MRLRKKIAKGVYSDGSVGVSFIGIHSALLRVDTDFQYQSA